MRVLAPSGPGKTTAAQAFIRDVEKRFPPGREQRPVLHVSLDRATTVKKFYASTVGLHELQRCSARIAQDIYELVHGTVGRKFWSVLKLPFNALDYLLMRLLGLTNAWGESVSRPCALLAGIFATFGLLYAFAPFGTDIAHPFQKSFDITLLVGYGNQAAAADTRLSLVQDIHAGVAIILYTVFLSTMISKLSRAR